jgi:hypothetical protein
MIRIRPTAPFGETAWARPLLSMRITARIQLTGIANLCEASAMKAANGRPDDEAVERAVAAGSARVEPEPSSATPSITVAAQDRSPDRSKPSRRARE